MKIPIISVDLYGGAEQLPCIKIALRMRRMKIELKPGVAAKRNFNHSRRGCKHLFKNHNQFFVAITSMNEERTMVSIKREGKKVTV